MSKQDHELRDPIHVFVRLTSDERRVVDSRPFQRLRHIHQLALTSMLYPAATHKRFEHSLGVMELAGRVFDSVTDSEKVNGSIRDSIDELRRPSKLEYWRSAVRMAALCHDMGHLPFSHAAEKELLPAGWDHERLTREIIRSEELGKIFRSSRPTLIAEDIEKLAVGPRKAKGLKFTQWETILSEIIVGDAFGVDRMDYLLRDSYHLGVPYGKFDHFRLIDTLRILPSGDAGSEPSLGVELGGLDSAEALLLGRYYMYSQVYIHPTRRIYDIHLKDFLAAWLPSGKFPTDIPSHLSRTDNEVFAGILLAARDSTYPGHDAARRIAEHDHFKLLYQRHPVDIRVNPEAGTAVYKAAVAQFGEANVRRDFFGQSRDANRFPVLFKDGRLGVADEASVVLQHLPLVTTDFVFIHPDLMATALAWLAKNRGDLIRTTGEK